MKAAHTPGPWAMRLGDTGEDIEILGPYNSNITVCDKVNSTEDARLIKAAPEMLEMIKNLMACVKRLTEDNVTQYQRDIEAEWIGEANELIREATGS